MYPYTHVLLSVEPDLCEVATAARPAEQSASKGAIGCRHVVFIRVNVTEGSDDGVLISVT